jgi:hypothetical protein
MERTRTLDYYDMYHGEGQVFDAKYYHYDPETDQIVNNDQANHPTDNYDYDEDEGVVNPTPENIEWHVDPDDPKG